MKTLPWLLFSLAFVSEPQNPPAPAAFQLGAVLVTGTSRYTTADVTTLSALKAGQPVAPSDLDKA